MLQQPFNYWFSVLFLQVIHAILLQRMNKINKKKIRSSFQDHKFQYFDLSSHIGDVYQAVTIGSRVNCINRGGKLINVAVDCDVT